MDPFGDVLFWVVLFFLSKDLQKIIPWKSTSIFIGMDGFSCFANLLSEWIVVGFIVRDGWLFVLVSLLFCFKWVDRVVQDGALP